MNDIKEKLVLFIVGLVSLVILLLTIVLGPWVAILLVIIGAYLLWKLWNGSKPRWPW